jgi:uncharacterized membrane protein
MLAELPEIVFRGGFPTWGTILMILAAFAAGFAFYFRESTKLTNARRAILGTLRTLILLAILFLILKPVMVSDTTVDRPKPIQLLIDNSLSMKQKDPRVSILDKVRVSIARDLLPPDHGSGPPASSEALPSDRPSRGDIVRAIFENPRLNLVAGLRNKGPVQPYLFGSRLRGFADTPDKPWLTAYALDDQKTNLTDTLSELLQRDEVDLPGAFVVVTDGRDNGSATVWDDLAREAKRLGVPVHVYGVGGSGTGFLQFKDAVVQDTLFVEDVVNVPFRWRAQGIKDGEVELSLTLAGKVVASKRVPVKDGVEVTETLSFTPAKDDAKPGRQELVAAVKILHAGDVLEDRIAKNVRVADRKVKMLYIESNPRWEFKFMQRAFLRDRRVEPTFIVINGDRKAMESGAPFVANFPDQRKDLFSYDLLVIGDVDANYFTNEQRNWIKDFVAEGGGLVMIAGRLHAPSSWLGTPLAEILPVEVPSLKFPIDDTKRPNEFKAVLSDQGKRSSMMSMADEPAESGKVWAEFPGFYWYYPVTKLRPAAVSLMDHPKDKMAEEKPVPLMAMHYYGKGLVLYSGIEETWRWRFNEADKYFTRFWGQVIYAVGLPHTLGSKTGTIAIAGGDAVLGKNGQVFARLFTPEYRPLTQDRVTAQIERKDAAPGEERFRTIVFEAVANQPGEYSATLPNDRVGQYTMKVDSGGESSTLDYRVTLPPEHELAPGPMNEDALRTLAESTGGSFHREEDLAKLVDRLERKTVPVGQRNERLLWNSWTVWAIVVGLFTLEWLVRKFSNLS